MDCLEKANRYCWPLRSNVFTRGMYACFDSRGLGDAWEYCARRF